MAGFAEQSKASVLHMSSLFHGFILCQVRILVCSHGSSVRLSSEIGIIYQFTVELNLTNLKQKLK
jgi:hypothetical protein